MYSVMHKPLALHSFLLALVLLPLVSGGIKTKTSGDAAFKRRLTKEQSILHALGRLTFGPGPGDVENVRKVSLKEWIDLQLHPERIPENAELAARLAPLSSLKMNNKELAANYPSPQMVVAVAMGRAPLPQDPGQRATLERLALRYKNKFLKKGIGEESKLAPIDKRDIKTLPEGARRNVLATAPPDVRRKMLLEIAPQQVLAHDLAEGKLYRAIYSTHQLSEVLTDFWFNHFNIYLDKGADRYLVTSYERDAIRPHVLGKFRDMLGATAESPAMLWYLDNWQSVAPAAVNQRVGPKAGKRSRGLNENYARELLELHTLGVDGGYTQKDIVEVARCFTGWTITEPYRGAAFSFNPRVHDNGEKVVLGVTIPAGGGKEDGLKVLDIAAHHPSTARFLSRKLAQRFVADNPPESLVAAMAKTFTRTDGDLRAVMQTMLASREFWSEGAYRAKVKSPLEMVAGAVRAAGADVTFAFGLATKVAELGQPLYRKQEPTGYSSANAEWVNSGALLARMNFALALVQNKLPGVKVDATRFQGDATAVARGLLFTEASAQTRGAIERGQRENKDGPTIAGLVLGSPEFQRR
ncbi:MAG TPA: DUF1800 domain-containing protein [Bryobacteraceae bacterium]|nr:DUF1800 domain-containing protein [Bryobacteraceae bacterium]